MKTIKYQLVCVKQVVLFIPHGVILCSHGLILMPKSLVFDFFFPQSSCFGATIGVCSQF